MSEDPTTPPTPEERESRLREREAFNKVADAMEPLGREARMRLFQLLATHFDVSFGNASDNRTSIKPSSAQISATTPSSFSEDRSLSPKQFMIEKKPVTDVERITCLAYYLAHYREQQYFRTLDLSKLNTEAAQVKFSNAAKTVDNATAAGFLSQVGAGKKQLSANGELYVQALPDRLAAKAAIAHAKPRRRPNKPKTDTKFDA